MVEEEEIGGHIEVSDIPVAMRCRQYEEEEIEAHIEVRDKPAAVFK